MTTAPAHFKRQNYPHNTSQLRSHSRNYWVYLAIAILCASGVFFARGQWWKLILFSAIGGSSLAALDSAKQVRSARLRVLGEEWAEESGELQSYTERYQGIRGQRSTKEEREEESVAIDDDGDDAIDPAIGAAMEIKDDVGRSLILSLMSFGIDAELKGIQQGLAFDRYLLRPGAGVTVAAIEKTSKDLMVNVGIKSLPIIQAVAGAIAIDVPRSQRRFAAYIDHIDRAPEDAEAWMPIGLNQLTGELIGIDFADSNCPHFLMGGTTGGGKSELLRSAVHYLSTNPMVKLGLIDIKMSTWEDFDLPVVHSGTEAIARLFKLVRHMEDRRKVRSKVGAKDLATYNLTADEPLPRIIYFIEELKDLLDALKFAPESELEMVNEAIAEAFDSSVSIGNDKGQIKPYAALLMAIARIGQAGRSEGIHLGIVTQDPDKKLLDDLISNLPVKIALRTRSHVESNLIQCPGADKLMGKGDLLLNVPGKPIDRCQSLYLD